MHGRGMFADQPEYAMSHGTAPGSCFVMVSKVHPSSQILECFADMHHTHGKKADAYFCSVLSLCMLLNGLPCKETAVSLPACPLRMVMIQGQVTPGERR